MTTPAEEQRRLCGYLAETLPSWPEPVRAACLRVLLMLARCAPDHPPVYVSPVGKGEQVEIGWNRETMWGSIGIELVNGTIEIDACVIDRRPTPSTSWGEDMIDTENPPADMVARFREVWSAR